MPLRKTGLLSRNTELEPSSMESVPDGLNRDGYASSTSLLSNPPGRCWSNGKTVSERGVGDKSILGTGLPKRGRSLTSPDAA